MPRYHFNLDDCDHRVLDDEGQELACLEAAYDAGIDAARDIMAGEVRRGSLCLGCRIEVADLHGHVLLIVPFSEAVKVTGLS